MSILIRGMDMPKKCCECVFSELSPTGESLICNNMLFGVPWDERPFDCPLVEVPTPHGRLIDIGDATSALCDLKRVYVGSVFDNLINDAARDISDCQTILEAEE